MTSSPNTMKPREIWIHKSTCGYDSGPPDEQMEFPSEYTHYIEKTPQVSKALKQAELFYEVVKQLEIAFIVCEMNPTTTGQKTLAEIKALIQQCKEASK